MSREYIISVPNDAGFVEYSYISGGRKYQTHYAYRKMEHLVRCKDCKHWLQAPQTDNGWCDRLDGLFAPTWWCADGERSE